MLIPRHDRTLWFIGPFWRWRVSCWMRKTFVRSNQHQPTSSTWFNQFPLFHGPELHGRLQESFRCSGSIGKITHHFQIIHHGSKWHQPPLFPQKVFRWVRWFNGWLASQKGMALDHSNFFLRGSVGYLHPYHPYHQSPSDDLKNNPRPPRPKNFGRPWGLVHWNHLAMKPWSHEAMEIGAIR